MLTTPLDKIYLFAIPTLYCRNFHTFFVGLIMSKEKGKSVNVSAFSIKEAKVVCDCDIGRFQVLNDTNVTTPISV